MILGIILFLIIAFVFWDLVIRPRWVILKREALIRKLLAAAKQPENTDEATTS